MHRLANGFRALTVRSVIVVVAFAFVPYLGFASENAEELPDIGRLLTYAALTAALSLAALVGLLTLLGATGPDGEGSVRPADRLGIAIAVVLVCFFNYYRIFDAEPPVRLPALQLGFWLILTGALVALAWRLATFPAVRTFVLLAGVLLCFGSTVAYLSSRPDPAPEVRAEPAEDLPRGPAARPSNIYFFLLDQYPRGDQLEAVGGFDNEPFLTDLEDRGFTVGRETFVNYMKTLLSIPSMLEMDYPTDAEQGLPGGILTYAAQLRGDNALVRRLEALGYRYVYANAGPLDWSDCDDTADECIEAPIEGLAFDETQLSLLRATPLGAIAPVHEPLTEPGYVLDQLDEIDPDEPFFLFAHILSPHGPQRYEKDCTRRSQPWVLSNPLTEADLEAFVQDIPCLNEELLETVDRIARNDPDAVVVLLSDHGTHFLPGYGSRLADWPAASLREIFGPLDAIRLPDGCEKPADGPRSVVNTFRIVLGCIEDHPVDYLEDRAFVWGGGGDYTRVEEIDDPTEVLAPVDASGS